MKIALLALVLLAARLAAAATVEVSCAPEAAEICDPGRIAAQVAESRERVAAFLGRPAIRPILVHVGDSWRGRPVEVTRSWPEAGRMVIPPRILARGIVPLAHELTHLLAGRGASNLLTEGLAVLAQARCGDGPAFPNFGQPLERALDQALARATRLIAPPRLEEIDGWIDDLDRGAERRLGYLLAGLFVQHLLDEVLGGDRERLLRLYASGDYRGMTGTDGDTLLARWWAARPS
jgi:hypothetical protein